VRDQVRHYRNLPDRIVVLVTAAFFLIGMARVFARPGQVGLLGDLGFAAFAAVLGWFCLRIGLRCGVSVSPAEIRVVNPLRTTTFPPEACAAVRADWVSLVFVLGHGRRLRAWGLGTSPLLGSQDVRDAIDWRVREATRRRGRTGRAAEPVRTRVRADAWLALVLFGLFAADIAMRRLGWWG
jgi:hypothetical protein